MNLRELQKQVGEWSRRNFGDQDPINPLLGIGEEYGELLHAVLKERQGIRKMQGEVAKAAKVDAVADLLIYLADFCERNDLDLDAAVVVTWAKVSQRDWKKKPETAAE